MSNNLQVPAKNVPSSGGPSIGVTNLEKPELPSMMKSPQAKPVINVKSNLNKGNSPRAGTQKINDPKTSFGDYRQPEHRSTNYGPTSSGLNDRYNDRGADRGAAGRYENPA